MRKDGVMVKGSDDFTALFPYLFKKRNESIVYYNLEVDVEPLLKYIADNKNVTFFQAVIIGLTKTLKERPKLNRFIIGRRLYQRNYTEIGFVTKREFTEEAAEVNVKIRFKDEDGPSEIIGKMTKDIHKAKKDGDSDDGDIIKVLMKFPRFFIRFFIWLIEWMDFNGILPKSISSADPLRSSVYVANLGSVGIDAPFHHLFEWGTTSIFLAIGKIGKKPVVDQDGQIVAKTMVEMKISLDERVADGFYYAKSLDLFRAYMENPERLMEGLK